MYFNCIFYVCSTHLTLNKRKINNFIFILIISGYKSWIFACGTKLAPKTLSIP